MTITGNTSRSIVRNNAFSALFDLSFSNTTGVAEVGFSGENKKYNFSFSGGKIFDNQNRYFSSYYPFSPVSIATNFSGQAYDYSVNSNMVTYSGFKDSFYADNFYLKATGVTIDASVVIKSRKPSLTLSLPDSFVTGQFITGYLVTNSVSGLKVFTGDFGDLSSFSFYSLPTGQITSISSGQVLISQSSPVIGKYTSLIDFDTTAGSYTQDVSIYSVEEPYLNYILTSNLKDDSFLYLSQPGIITGVAKGDYLSVNYNYATNYQNLIPTGLQLTVSLSYESGATGYYGLLADASVESGGNGYLSAPTIIFSGGFTGNLVQAFSSGSDLFRRPNSVSFTFYSGQSIAFYKPSSSVLPSPMIENKTYYVRDLSTVTSSDFAISETSTGLKFDITNTGSGNFYFYDPTMVASAQAVLGQTKAVYDQVVGINILNYGSGYSSTPTIIFSGGTGIINNADPTVASGNASMIYYTKSFTGSFNLFTGIGDDYKDYRQNNYISNQNYSSSSSFNDFNLPINIKVEYTPLLDSDPMIAKLLISGTNNLIIEKYITGVR